MNRSVLLALLCAIGATACSHLREPSDAQLAALLRSERAAPADANALLDGRAIECLRAWSGDKELLSGLPMRVAGEDGRKECRGNLDGWIADASRNPDKFSFADVSTPKVVRRAMALFAARAPAPDHRPPSALTNSMSRPPSSAPLTPVDGPEMGAPGNTLKEAESRCEQVQQLVASGNTEQRLQRFASYCAGTLRRMRASMQNFSVKGNPEMMENIAKDANNLATTADMLISNAANAPKP